VNIVIIALCVAVPAMAQSATPAPSEPYAAQASRATMAPVAPAATPAAAQRGSTPAPTAAVAAAHAPDPRIDPSDVNIKLSVKIPDNGPGGTQNKVVSLIMANRGSGRVRSSGNTLTANGTQNRGSELNVDAMATLYKSGAIHTNLTINYQPEWTEDTTKLTGVMQQVELFLKDGAPMVITQAADPTKGSRSVSIEVTAQVLK
jgi:hypothetical protein